MNRCKITHLIPLLLLFSSAANSQQDVNFESSNLPIVIIDTHGEQIVNEPKITADLGIIFNGNGIRNHLNDPFNNYKGRIGIEIRGSSSQQFPKKQYGFETRDSSGEGVDVSLLGLPEENDWILYAPYNDKSLVRDALVYRLSNDMGRYASRSRYCELILNGKYMGVYILFEKIKRNKNRVNISKISETDTTGDKLTGGYIIKVDKEEGGLNTGWVSPYKPYGTTNNYRINYLHHYPDPEDIVPEQADYIKTFMDKFEETMYRHSMSDTVDYHNLIDVNSFVDHFLISELSKNVDAYRLSSFMYKDRDSKNGKLMMGPVWDFNLAFGNANYHRSWFTNNWMLSNALDPYVFQNEPYQVPFWWGVLYRDQEFLRNAGERWKELRKNVLTTAKVLGYVDSLSAYLGEAQKRNFQAWPVLGQWIWPNQYVGQTFNDELNYLKNWITQRFTWMDQEFDKITFIQDRKDKVLPEDYSLEQNYPNPFNPSTVIRYKLPMESTVTIKVYNALGQIVRVWEESNRGPGFHYIRFDAKELSSGIYLYELRANEFRAVRKMQVIK